MNNVDLAGIYASGYIDEKDVKVLKSIDFDFFLNKTALPFGLLGCRIRFNIIYSGLLEFQTPICRSILPNSEIGIGIWQ